MSKSILNQKYVYKIESTRFKKNNWNLNLTIDEAFKNRELVSLGDSNTLRMIKKICNKDFEENDINNIKKEIKEYKRKNNSKENRGKIKELYDKLYNIIVYPEYLCIVFDSINDWNNSNSKKIGVTLNGVKYKRLVGTNGGVKKNVVVFVSENIHSEISKMMDNGRYLNKKYVPAKFESYKAITCSASTPVSNPKKMLVIKDMEIEIEDNVIYLSGNNEGRFDISYEDNMKLKKQPCDGCGIITEKLAKQWAIEVGEYYLKNEEKIEKYIPSGFKLCNSFLKGMVYTFPVLEFADEIAHNYFVTDAWGNQQDIREVDLIVTTNMLKLWDSYTSVEHYLNCCEENNYTFGIIKTLPRVLEKTRNMNYQFLASYKMSDEDILEFVKPTVENIKGALGGSYEKTLLFLKGCKIDEDDFKNEEQKSIKALMIEKELLKDPYITNRIQKMINKKINDSKKGVLEVKGNYCIVSGDLYALCQHMFGLPITGLLKRNEFYCNSWNKENVSEIMAFRAPMSNHNNVRKLNLINNNLVNKWYKYMKTCVIVNAFDTTLEAMNGADMDMKNVPLYSNI